MVGYDEAHAQVDFIRRYLGAGFRGYCFKWIETGKCYKDGCEGYKHELPEGWTQARLAAYRDEHRRKVREEVQAYKERQRADEEKKRAIM